MELIQFLDVLCGLQNIKVLYVKVMSLFIHLQNYSVVLSDFCIESLRCMVFSMFHFDSDWPVRTHTLLKDINAGFIL